MSFLRMTNLASNQGFASKLRIASFSQISSSVVTSASQRSIDLKTALRSYDGHGQEMSVLTPNPTSYLFSTNVPTDRPYS